MPHIPDHTTHDPELVAAYAAGDATGADLRAATDLVATCPACAELHHDLRAIATALPEAAVPVRPRDFRLTPEQAAALRPAGWRGLLAAFAGPRFRFAAPLGLGLATLGLAGILVGSLAGLPLGVGGAATSGSAESGGAAFGRAAAPEAASAAPSAADQAASKIAPSGAPAPSAAAAAPAVPGASSPAEPVAAAPAGPAGPPPLDALSIVALAGGVLLLAGRFAGRRLARAP